MPYILIIDSPLSAPLSFSLAPLPSKATSLLSLSCLKTNRQLKNNNRNKTKANENRTKEKKKKEKEPKKKHKERIQVQSHSRLHAHKSDKHTEVGKQYILTMIVRLK